MLAAEPARGAALLPRRARRRTSRGAGSCSTTTVGRSTRATTSATRRRSSRCASWRPTSPAAATSSELRAQLAQVRMVEQPPGDRGGGGGGARARAGRSARRRGSLRPPTSTTWASPRSCSSGRWRETASAVLERDPVGSGRRRGSSCRTSSAVTCYRPRLTWGSWKVAFGGFPFGGDPEDLLRGLREFAEQQAESVQEAQREQFATLTLNTAVELTAAALAQSARRHGGRAVDRDARRDARALPRGGRARQRRPPGLHARAPLT